VTSTLRSRCLVAPSAGYWQTIWCKLENTFKYDFAIQIRFTLESLHTLAAFLAGDLKNADIIQRYREIYPL